MDYRVEAVPGFLPLREGLLWLSRARRGAFADFSAPFPHPCRCGSLSAGPRRIYLLACPDDHRSPAHGRVTPLRRPSIRFRFVESEFYCQLSSVPTFNPPSRWAPLPGLAVPATTACRGLSSPRAGARCPAHERRAQDVLLDPFLSWYGWMVGPDYGAPGYLITTPWLPGKMLKSSVSPTTGSMELCSSADQR